MAKSDNTSEITPFARTLNVITAPGIGQNTVIRIGYEYKITPDLSFLSELSRYETRTKIDNDSFNLARSESFETGVQLRF